MAWKISRFACNAAYLNKVVNNFAGKAVCGAGWCIDRDASVLSISSGKSASASCSSKSHSTAPPLLVLSNALPIHFIVTVFASAALTRTKARLNNASATNRTPPLLYPLLKRQQNPMVRCHVRNHVIRHHRLHNLQRRLRVAAVRRAVHQNVIRPSARIFVMFLQHIKRFLH